MNSLQQLTKDLYASAAFLWAGSTLAVVTQMDGWYWVRLYTGDDRIFGNRVRPDLASTIALLAQAGVPSDRGWVTWQPIQQ
jgi:hypothetical protein